VLTIDAVRDGAAAGIPLIVGTTLDEARLFAGLAPQGDDLDEAELTTRLLGLFGAAPDRLDLAERAIAAYRATRAELGRGASLGDLFVDAMTDRMFRQHSLRLAEAASVHQPATYMYLFTWESPVAGGRLGACHAVELGFVFGTLDSMARFAGDGPDAEALSAAVQDAWLSFARTGSPTAPSLPPWPSYGIERRTTMLLGAERTVVDAPLDAIRQVWVDAER
jgi:para-nitrobenzyl esterase